MIYTDFGEIPRANYSVIYADPPWKFKTYSDKGLGRSPEARHYSTMRLPEIAALPVNEIAGKDAFLFMWIIGTHMPHALELIKSWGFRYSSTAFIWAKTKKNTAPENLTPESFVKGLGYTTRKNCEICLLAKRGSPKRQSANIGELVISPRREHSRKPDEVASHIADFSDGPYIELFARTARPGWDAWGNEPNRFEAVL